MSPASRSKSKDKRAGKEPPKAAPKPSGANAGGGIPASGYNPLSGTFHVLDSGRFRNIDETDAVEYDSVSNNGSWSGESEDHKEKISNPPSVPGADNDKREKIRQKNEKKHQRQKERRAQELHEKCTGYLMSRKLEALAQQLVAMGFSSERATMALIQNEGKLEESVSWLFEGAEEACKYEQQTLDSSGGNLKIDISEELARMADMEIKYKCSKQEVERVVVASEGDLSKTDETLRSQKQEPQSVPPKPEENQDPPTIANGRLAISTSQNSTRATVKPSSTSTIPSKRDERDLNYNIEPPKMVHPRLEVGKPLQVVAAVDRRQLNPGLNPSLPIKTEIHYGAVRNELKNLQLGTVREPVIVVQRPQSFNPNHQTPTSTVTSSLPGPATGWYPNNTIETVKPNGVMPHIPGTRSLSTNQLYSQHHYEPHHQPQHFVSSTNSSLEPPGTSQGNSLWGGRTVAAASSLGLFSRLGTNDISRSSPHIDWNSGCGSMLQQDYTNIDWSLDSGSLPSRAGSMWPMNSLNNARTYDSFATRPVVLNRSGVHGFEDGVAKAEKYGGSREWTSPFEERDLFSLPRQFASAPSL